MGEGILYNIDSVSSQAISGGHIVTTYTATADADVINKEYFDDNIQSASLKGNLAGNLSGNSYTYGLDDMDFLSSQAISSSRIIGDVHLPYRITIYKDTGSNTTYARDNYNGAIISSANGNDSGVFQYAIDSILGKSQTSNVVSMFVKSVTGHNTNSAFNDYDYVFSSSIGVSGGIILQSDYACFRFSSLTGPLFKLRPSIRTEPYFGHMIIAGGRGKAGNTFIDANHTKLSVECIRDRASRPPETFIKLSGAAYWSHIRDIHIAGPRYGIDINGVSNAVRISNCDFGQTLAYKIRASGGALSHLIIEDCWMEGHPSGCVYVYDADKVEIKGCYFSFSNHDAVNRDCIYLENSKHNNIHHNYIGLNDDKEVGIKIGSTTYGSLINNNIFGPKEGGEEIHCIVFTSGSAGTRRAIIDANKVQYDGVANGPNYFLSGETLIECSIQNNVIESTTRPSNSGNAIYLIDSYRNLIQGNLIYDYETPIKISGVGKGNLITDNYIYDGLPDVTAEDLVNWMEMGSQQTNDAFDFKPYIYSSSSKRYLEYYDGNNHWQTQFFNDGDNPTFLNISSQTISSQKISGGSYNIPMTADQIIYRDGDIYCCRSGRDGSILATNNDASTLFNSVLSPYIYTYVASGIYNISSTIQVKNHSKLYGAGPSTRFELAEGSYDAFNISGDRASGYQYRHRDTVLGNFNVDLPDPAYHWYSGNVVHFECKTSDYDWKNHRSIRNAWVEKINIYCTGEDDEWVTYTQSGSTGLKYSVTGNRGTIYFCYARDLYMHGVGTGIHLYTCTGNLSNLSEITTIQFKNILFWKPIIGINFDNNLSRGGHDPDNVYMKNCVFENMNMQCGYNTTDGYKNISNGGHRFINCNITDYHSCTNPNYAISIYSGTTYTDFIITPAAFSTPSYFYDSGSYTNYVGRARTYLSTLDVGPYFDITGSATTFRIGVNRSGWLYVRDLQQGSAYPFIIEDNVPDYGLVLNTDDNGNPSLQIGADNINRDEIDHYHLWISGIASGQSFVGGKFTANDYISGIGVYADWISGNNSNLTTAIGGGSLISNLDGDSYTYGLDDMDFLSSQAISGGTYRGLPVSYKYIINTDDDNKTYFLYDNGYLVSTSTTGKVDDILEYTCGLCRTEGHGNIFINEGDYKLSGLFWIPDNVTIIGTGDSTMFYGDMGSNSEIIVSGSNILLRDFSFSGCMRIAGRTFRTADKVLENITFENLHGKNVNVSGQRYEVFEQHAGYNGMRAYGALDGVFIFYLMADSKVRNVYYNNCSVISSTAHGFELRGGRDTASGSFYNVHYNDCLAQGITMMNVGSGNGLIYGPGYDPNEVVKLSKDIFFNNCIAKNCYRLGFHLENYANNPTFNINYINCVAEDCGRAREYFQGGEYDSYAGSYYIHSGCTMVGCKSIRPRRYGVWASNGGIIRDCYFEGYNNGTIDDQYGIYALGDYKPSNRFIIENSLFRSLYGLGIYVLQSSGSQVKGNHFYDIGKDGNANKYAIDLGSSTGGFTIDNNTIYMATNAGADSMAIFVRGNKHTITNNKVMYSPKYGIYALSGDDQIYSENMIFNCGAAGLSTGTGTNRHTITNNNIRDITGIGINVRSNDCIVTNNTVRNTSSYAINADSPYTHNIISNNNVSGETMSINDKTHSRITDNIGYATPHYSSQGIYADWVSGNNTNLVGASNYIKDNADDSTSGLLTSTGGGFRTTTGGVSGAKMSGGTIYGHHRYILQTKTANYSAVAGEYVLASNSITIKLPDSHSSGDNITVKNIGTGTVTVSGQSGDTIDGDVDYDMQFQYESVTVVSDGTNWYII